MLFLLIFLICITGLILFFASDSKRPKKQKRRIVAVAILLLPLVMFAFMKITKGFVPIPLWVRSITHSIFVPKDLYEPIVTDNFLFYEKGFTKTYTLKPKYLDFYVIGFLVENRNLPSKYKFSGKVRTDFYWKDELLFSKEITSHIAAAYSDNDLKYFSDVLLLDFEIPFQGRYKDDISVRLTVLEPDDGLKEYGDSIKLFIGVSPIP